MTRGHKALAAGRDMLAPQTWRDLGRLVNFFRYDVAEQRAIRTGSSVKMSPTVSVRNGRRVSIGDGAHIGQWSSLWAGDDSGTITIGDHALLAPRVFITASNYDFAGRPGPVMDLPRSGGDVVIGKNTWLGVGVVVLAGVTIGADTVVAAGAVVVGDLPPGCLAAGIPARPIRMNIREPI